MSRRRQPQQQVGCGPILLVGAMMIGICVCSGAYKAIPDTGTRVEMCIAFVLALAILFVKANMKK